MQHPQVQIGLGQEQFAGDSGLGLAQRREVDVGPAGEEIELVPRRLSVAQENEVRHRTSVPRAVAASNGTKCGLDGPLTFIGLF